MPGREETSPAMHLKEEAQVVPRGLFIRHSASLQAKGLTRYPRALGAFESVSEHRAHPGGTLRLVVPRFAYGYVLQPHLSDFLAEYPDIRLDLYADDAVVDLASQGFDAAIRLGETLDRDMVAVRASEDQRLAVVGTPAYFPERGTPKRPKDLRNHNCINYRRAPGAQVYRWESRLVGGTSRSWSMGGYR